MMTAFNGYAQTETWTGTKTLNDGVTINGTVRLNGTVTLYVPTGTAVINAVMEDFNAYNPGGIIKTGAGKVILAGDNTYSEQTTVDTGTLQIGNGVSGNLHGTSNVVIVGGATLRFEPGGGITFNKVITGNGNVEYKNKSNEGSMSLDLTENNTYTGTTTIEVGRLSIQKGHAGNIINNGELVVFGNNEITYEGVISGTGGIAKTGVGDLVLTGANTFGGVCHFYNVAIVLTKTGSIENSAFIHLLNEGAKLNIAEGNKRIRNLDGAPGSEVILGASTLTIGTSTESEDGGGDFHGVISGTGGIIKQGTNILYLTGDNSYTGTSTVESGVLAIGNYGGAGSVVGNIINNATVFFLRGNAYTYSGIISGSGNIHVDGGGVLTLNGANTYTGTTYINISLVLGVNGSIENSLGVYFRDYAGKFNISDGNKKIKGLSGENNAEVNLGSRTLTIGTSGQNDGSGNYSGKFTGTGGITKNGTGTLILNTENTPSGTFTHNQGRVELTHGWNGNYFKESGTLLQINNSVNIAGTMTMTGGEIEMDLTTTPPSRIIVSGAMNASGVNKLSIVSNAVSNQMIIQAASGIGNTTPYQLNMPGYTASLEATGTQLLLTATVNDNIPPTVGAGVEVTAGASESAIITWSVANDETTSVENLRYFVYRSLSDNITTVSDCESNGELLNTNGTPNITEYEAKSLSSGTTHYFNVVVADMANNKAAYTPKSIYIEIVGNPPVIITKSLPDGEISTLYNYMLSAESDSPVTWTHESGNFPAGLELSENGLISGTPTSDDTFVFIVKATNKSGSATQELTLVVYKFGRPVITTTSLAYGYIDVFYNQTLTVNDACLKPITWLITAGSLPPGLIHTNGIISGVPKATGTFTFTIQAINSVGSDTKTLSISIGNVGIEDELGIRNYELKVYPNPTFGELRIENGELRMESGARGHDPLSSEVEIFDVFGHCISPAGGGRGWTFPSGNGQRCISPAGGGQGVDFAGGGQGVDSSNPNEITLDISHLPNGIYFLRVNGKTAKVIKN